jgi:predicted regulator of Ras-like GTPase activity (Roadblock/LC7/MglB family)
MDSMAMGKRAIPAMDRLAERLPQLRCAVLCTADGFNICSIGVTEQQLGKMAALTGSLFTMGAATLASLDEDTLAAASPVDGQSQAQTHAGASISQIGTARAGSPHDGSKPGELGVLTLEASGCTIVAVQVPHATQTLVLLIAAQQTPLGVLHLRARQSAEELGGLFGPRARPTAVERPSHHPQE